MKRKEAYLEKVQGLRKKKLVDPKIQTQNDTTIFCSINSIIALLLLIAIIDNLFGFVFCDGNNNAMCQSIAVIIKIFHNENGEIERGKKCAIECTKFDK